MSNDLAISNGSVAVVSWAPATASGDFQQSRRTLYRSLRGPALAGYAISAIFILGFGVWAAYAPLSGGATALGIVSPNGARRAVQHLEGGIVRDIRVKDGDVVEEGQPLITLTSAQSTSNYETLVSRRVSLLARQVRLQAERQGAETVTFPSELYVDNTLEPAAQSQLEIFEARRAAFATRKELLVQRIDQLQHQMEGQRKQIDNLVTQLSFIHEEVQGKETLLGQGLLPKPEALRLRRTETELIGRRVEIDTEIDKAKQQIEETKLQIVSAADARLDEIVSESEKAQSELAETDEHLKASKDILSRSTVLAPVSGTIINLRVKTVGGVVQPGDTIMEIVPRDNILMIDAHVSPNDVQRVHIGQLVQIHLSAYSTRIMPRLEGMVRSVSADRVHSESDPQGYFLVRVEVNQDLLKKRAATAVVMPGMGADVVFVAEQRTMLEYLIKPFRDALRLGLREQ
jgi:HlyD family secretion protein/epimerase transport system membrane fusion protein